MGELVWSSGIIRKLMQDKVGIIEQNDGQEVLFDIADLQEGIAYKIESESNLSQQLVGRRVHYRTEQTNLGLQAREIALLIMK
jgi:cold shock CspA family protein